MFSDHTEILKDKSKGYDCLIKIADSSPKSIPEAFLKLILSHKLAKPNSINLDGLFGILKNLAWTNQGPIDLMDLPLRQLEARTNGC